jgi:hypothetical protein
MRLSSLVFASLILLGGSAVAQVTSTGIIKGRVFEADSGESMPYTNIYIAGTSIGTMAFTDGYYIIRGLRPGTYTLKASYISYAVGSATVTLEPGQVVVLDFRLDRQAILVDAVEVEAERALIEQERTGSTHYISARQLEAMPLDQMIDMVAQQPGVTIQDNEIHVRGGRADDTQFLVDGVSVADPLAGGGYGYQIDPSIINEIEVLTGGFNAEYGQAVAGVVNVTTKEGGDRLEGNVSLRRDYLTQPIPKDDYEGWNDTLGAQESQNIDVFKVSLSGPDPITRGLRALGLDLPGTQYAIVSGSMDIRDGYLPINSRHDRLVSPMYPSSFWSPREESDWNGLAKWTWNPDFTRKFSLSSSRQISINQGFDLAGEGYPRPFRDNLDNYLVFTSESILTNAYWRQVLGDKDWYEITLGRSWSRLHANVNGEDDFTTYEPIPASNGPAELAGGSADRWHDHYSESWTAKGTYSFYGGAGNQFKTGFEMSFTEMQLIDLKSKLGEAQDGTLAKREDIFVAHPITGAGFFQDSVEYHGLIINGGVRADLWAPGREVEEVMAHEEDYLFIYPEMVREFEDGTMRALGRNWKVRISPRLGLSFPVTKQDKFFFNYGHFSQWARFAYVYPQLQATRASDVPLLGNPNIDPKVTVEYEAGIQHEFEGLWSLGVTFFNRDIYGYAKSVTLDQVWIGAEETPDPFDTGSKPITPVRYFNGDSARSLGLEISLIKRTTRWLSGSASLELSRATGTNSDADNAYLAQIYDEAYTPYAGVGGLRRTPLLWDKPWSVNANLDFSVFQKDRPVLFGWRLPPNWSANLLMSADAGTRYTPRTWLGEGASATGDVLSKVGPTRSSVNLRFNKFWNLGGRQKLTFFLEGRNIFNHLDFRRVNPYTGEGYRVGDYNPAWEYKWDLPTNSEEYSKGIVDPSYVENPRVFLWGVSYQW